MNLDYIKQETDAEYHARSKSGEVLSSHMLSTFRWSPYKYRLKIDGKLEEPDSPAFAFGRAVHCCTLEGQDVFQRRYTVADGPVNPKTGAPYLPTSKAYLDWRAEQTGEVISTAEADIAGQMAFAVKNHPVAGYLLKGLDAGEYIPEAVVRTEYAGALCQIKMDAFRPEPFAIVDLKTCSDLAGFYYDISRPGYDYVFQAAFYRAVLRKVSGHTAHFYFVAVEKKFPYLVGVWHMSPDVLDQAQSDNEKRIAALLDCRASDVWPTGYEEIREYDKLLN